MPSFLPDVIGDSLVEANHNLEFALAGMDAESGWVQQLHMGAVRDVNSKFFARLGPNTGFDVIGDFPLARPLARYRYHPQSLTSATPVDTIMDEETRLIALVTDEARRRKTTGWVTERIERLSRRRRQLVTEKLRVLNRMQADLQGRWGQVL